MFKPTPTGNSRKAHVRAAAKKKGSEQLHNLLQATTNREWFRGLSFVF